jgi:hypothetical protein
VNEELSKMDSEPNLIVIFVAIHAWRLGRDSDDFTHRSATLERLPFIPTLSEESNAYLADESLKDSFWNVVVVQALVIHV